MTTRKVQGKRSSRHGGKKAKRSSPHRTETPATPAIEPLTPRDMVHDALDGLDAARRAFDSMTVHRFRGQRDLTQFDYVVFLEEIQRVHNWLTRLDLEMPDGGAS